MRAAVVRAFDTPPAYATFPDPTSQLGEVPVTVTAAAEPFQFSVKTALFSQVDSMWNSPERGSRLVFQP